MSLFSKLFGNDKEAEKAAKELFEGIFGNQEKPSGANAKEENQPSAPQPQEQPPQDSSPAESGPSGFSWGPVMPNEPNQYNYNGSFCSYFEEIFREEFPLYSVDKQTPQGLERFVYTFSQGGRKALVVELLGRSSSAKAVRAKCERENVPYLRFYYDFEGWWNTREYVKTRISNALR